MAKHTLVIHIAAITTLFIHCQAMVMRNNALINKMVSHFQKDFHSSEFDNRHNKGEEQISENQNQQRTQEQNQRQQEQKPEKVLSLMQNVLCRNFPSIPCNLITEDETLKRLIEKSILQIKYKTAVTERTTTNPGYLTLFPMVNSEDLSNFLQVQDTRTFYDKPHDDTSKAKKPGYESWLQKKTTKRNKKPKKDSKRPSIYSGRKKIRKFYPHKIKYKDKAVKNRKDLGGDYTEEKLSMSVEVPDMTLTKHHQHLSYKVEPADPPVWRIDYMKHGEPSLNKLRYDDERLKGKIMKTGPGVMVDENILEQGARKEVLHPDVYIKKNFIRKSAGENSDNMD